MKVGTRCAIAAAAVALICGCATTRSPVEFVGSTTFDPDAVAWAKQSGTATVEGNAFIIDPMAIDGSTQTCAGRTVALFPDSAYNREFLLSVFPNLNEAFWNSTGGGDYSKYPIPDFESQVRHAKCDAKGEFVFNNVPAGTYYATTEVYYIRGPNPTIPPNRQGGFLLKRAHVVDGQTTRLVMSK